MTHASEQFIESSPTIGVDGTIYIGSHDNKLYAINPDGTLKWRYDTNGSCLGNPIAIANDGTLYVTGSAFLDEEADELFRNAVYAFGGSSAEKEVTEQTDKKEVQKNIKNSPPKKNLGLLSHNS